MYELELLLALVAAIVNTAATLFCSGTSDILSRLSALRVKTDIFQWAEVMFCNFRTIKLIVASWWRALVRSDHDKVEQLHYKVYQKYCHNFSHIFLIRIVMSFYCTRSCTESDCLINSLMRRENSTKLIHSHYTVNSAIFLRTFKLLFLIGKSML